MSAGFIGTAIPLATFLLMVVVGLDLAPAEFGRVSRRRLVLVAGLLAPTVLLPPLALGLVALVQPSPAVAVGLLIVSACPIGGISNTYSLLARADTALSVALTTLSCLLAVVTIPAISAGVEIATGQALGLTAPLATLVLQLTLVIAVPVTAGMLVRARWPTLASRHQPALQRLALAMVALIVWVIVQSQFELFIRELPGTAPLAVVFVLLSMGAGVLVGRTIGADRAERVTLTLEFGTRNVAVATAIAVTAAGRPDFAVFGASYFLMELPLALAVAGAARRVGTDAATRLR